MLISSYVIALDDVVEDLKEHYKNVSHRESVSQTVWYMQDTKSVGQQCNYIPYSVLTLIRSTFNYLFQWGMNGNGWEDVGRYSFRNNNEEHLCTHTCLEALLNAKLTSLSFSLITIRITELNL